MRDWKTEKLVRPLAIISYLYPAVVGLVVWRYLLPPNIRPLSVSEIITALPMVAVAAVIWNVPFQVLQSYLRKALANKTLWIEPLLWAYCAGIASGTLFFFLDAWDNADMLLYLTVPLFFLTWLAPVGGMAAGLAVGWGVVFLDRRWKNRRRTANQEGMAGRQGFEPR